MRTSTLVMSLWLFPGVLAAQMTPDQRVQDFQNLTALYAKRYAPYEWKREALGFDFYNVTPWLDRVRRAQDDLEYYEIALEYVASLQDTHSRYSVPSNFYADLGFTVDIYDGKVLIDGINRSRLPQSQFPFKVGDELVSVDDKTCEDWITTFSRFRKYGNPLTTRRVVAGMLTLRPQSTIPRVVELGETATVVIRRESGDLETYTIPWTKSGAPLLKVGPVPTPKYTVRKAAQAEGVPDYLRPLMEMRNWRLPEDDPLFLGGTISEETGEVLPRRYLTATGSRNPSFLSGLPSNFMLRLGRASADFHFSGTYEAQGYKIGFLRVRSFGPSDQAAAIRELDTEIDFFQKNTNGLVIDVMHNPGGGCYMVDLAARLIPNEFYFFGELIRATQDRIIILQSALEAAKQARADQWIIDVYQIYLDWVKQAYSENRGLTGSVPGCNQFLSPLPPSSYQLPAAVVYTKPLIILVDEFSISAADIFPSMMQDNNRGLLVGMRTSGGGGSVSSYAAGFYSEATASNTNTLVVRKQPIVTAEYPAAPYVENIGARPDIPLNYMTRENLLNGGRTFVGEFTQIIVDEIKKVK
jgi:hypothetical protein